jgi:hypothetical protein
VGLLFVTSAGRTRRPQYTALPDAWVKRENVRFSLTYRSRARIPDTSRVMGNSALLMRRKGAAPHCPALISPPEVPAVGLP